jgi:hypothetical protein
MVICYVETDRTTGPQIVNFSRGGLMSGRSFLSVEPAWGPGCVVIYLNLVSQNIICIARGEMTRGL